MWYGVFGLSVLLLLSSCMVDPQSDTVTSHRVGEPQAPVQPSLWDRLTNQTGQIVGRFLLPDGSPAAGFTFDCKPVFDLPGGRATLGMASGPDGHFTCGGPPGTYQIEVYSKAGTGVIGTAQVDITARDVVTINLTIQP
jgi:hypothetical protein